MIYVSQDLLFTWATKPEMRTIKKLK